MAALEARPEKAWAATRYKQRAWALGGSGFSKQGKTLRGSALGEAPEVLCASFQGDMLA